MRLRGWVVALLIGGGLFLPGWTRGGPPDDRDLPGRAGWMEGEVHRALEKGDTRRLKDLSVELAGLESDLEKAIHRPGRGRPPAFELRGLLDLVRGLRREALRVSARSSWRTTPLPWIRRAPDVSRIRIRTEPDGTATFVGRAGAAGDVRAAVVRAVNLETTDEALARVRPDGSFAVRLMAPPGSSVQISTALGGEMPREVPEETRRRFESGKSLGSDEVPRHFLEMIVDGRTTSPAVILPVVTGEPGRAGFVTRFGDRAWVFGTGKLDRHHYEPGQAGELEVSVTLRVESADLLDRIAREPPVVDAILSPLFDANGRQRSDGRLLATHVLTPTGLPIETHGEMIAHRSLLGGMRIDPGGPGAGLESEPLEIGAWRRRGGTATIRERIRFVIPSNVPAGTYALRGHIWPGGGEGLLEGAPEGQAFFGVVTVGEVRPPRLASMLLASAGTGGSRGAIAREDRSAYNVSPHNVFQPAKLVIARDDARTGKPHPYALDPYLPLVSLTDRPGEMRIWPPKIRFDCTSSRLTVTVRRPDGTVYRLGPAPLISGRNDLTCVSPDRIVFDRLVAPAGPSYGNPSLADIYHLSGGPAFEYAFQDYGHHVVTLEGSVRDVAGNDYRIAGTYDVYVARPLDINVFPEPGTPLDAGRAVLPQVRVLPARPADVEIRFRHLPGSDPARAVERVVAGRANRWGVFVPDGATAPVVFEEPGEYVLDVTVTHVDDDGAWWMACRRGASVVSTPDSDVSAHGERGNRAPTQRWRARWFKARDSRFIAGTPPGAHDMGHTCYPYESGDVAWLGHRDPDSLFPSVTLEDPAGRIADAIEARWPAVREGAGRAGLYPDWLKPEDRRAIGELPLVCSSLSGLSPSMAPEKVDQWGYFYTTSWRPGVSVRSHVGEDLVPASYWFFDDPYGYQFGVGPHGDLPGDVKINYAGTVFRDAKRGIEHYGAYASMVVLIDAEGDPFGRRVMPPFDGLLPGSPPSGPLLEIGGKRYDLFLTFGAVSPGAVLTVGDRLAVSGVVWPPVAGLVRGTITSPSGRRTPFETVVTAMGVFDHPGPVVDEPGAWRITAEGILNGRTSAGRIADVLPEEKWPRGGGIGLERNTFTVPVVPSSAPSLAFDLPPGTRAAPPGPLVIRGRVPAGTTSRSVRVLAALPLGVVARAELPVSRGTFTYVYDPSRLAHAFPNLDLALPGPDPALRLPAWYDTVTFTFWTGEGPALRAGTVLLQGEDVYAETSSGRAAPTTSPAPADPPRRVERPRDPARRRTPGPGASGGRRSSLLALTKDGAALFAGHPHSGEVVRLVLGDGAPRVAATARPGGQVRSLAISSDGRRVYVALSDTRQVVGLDAATLREATRWTVAGEPWAVLPSRDGAAVFVADHDGNRVLRLDARDGRILGRSPTVHRASALAISADGRELSAIGFRSGDVTVLDEECRLLRRLPATGQWGQGRALTLGPDGALYAPQTRSDTRGGGRMFDRSVFPVVAVADPGGSNMRVGFSPDLFTVPPHRPVEAAVDAATLYLANAGSDDVVALDLGAGFPRWHARSVGREPGAVLLDRRRGRLYVLTVSGQEIVTLSAADGRVLSRVVFAHDDTPARIARGRYLFGTATDRRLTKDQWMSCAACHPDGGGPDGRQWNLSGKGILDTATLRGSMARPPLHYTAHLDEIQDTVRFTRLVMAGRWFTSGWRMNDPLGDSNAGLSRDLDDLAAYVESLTPKRPPPPPPDLLPLVERGKAVFESERAGCLACHAPPLYTDSGRRDADGDYLRHDVGTWWEGEDEDLRTLDTPSLFELRQSEPYLHDGRAATLAEVLTIHNPGDRHGTTSHLGDEDLRALVEFLRHLDPGPLVAAPRTVRRVVGRAEYERGDPVQTPPPGEEPPPGEPPPRDAGERDEDLQRRIGALRREAVEAGRQGDHDRAADLLEEAERLTRRLRERPVPGR